MNGEKVDTSAGCGDEVNASMQDHVARMHAAMDRQLKAFRSASEQYTKEYREKRRSNPVTPQLFALGCYIAGSIFFLAGSLVLLVKELGK